MRRTLYHLYICGIVGPILLALSVTLGCSTTPGGQVTIFPTGHFLLHSTKQVAKVATRPAPVPRELQKSVLAAYYIQPGDMLLLEPASFDSPLRFPSDQPVLPDGTIDLGRYGRQVVAGLTIEQIEQIVQRAVETVEKQDVGQVNVRLINPESAVYYVLGEVNAPGSYPLIGRETVLDALMTAGGLTDRASPCHIILSRPTVPDSCRVVLPVCYRQIAQLGDTTTNYQILPGDRVYVATSTLFEQLMPWANSHECALCRGQEPCQCADPNTSHYGPSLMQFPLDRSGRESPQPAEALPLAPPNGGDAISISIGAP